MIQERSAHTKSARIASLLIFGIAFALFAACGEAKTGITKESGDEISQEISDEMFEEFREDESVYAFIRDGRCFEIASCAEIDLYGEAASEEDGFYEITADVVYLNGGVAGYVDYPEIREIKAVKQLDASEVDLPEIGETCYGVVRIGSYADGEILLNEYGMMAVWKDGSWAYTYDKEEVLSDGTHVLLRSGVQKEEIESGIDAAVLSCEDYFVLP